MISPDFAGNFFYIKNSQRIPGVSPGVSTIDASITACNADTAPKVTIRPIRLSDLTRLVELHYMSPSYLNEIYAFSRHFYLAYIVIPETIMPILMLGQISPPKLGFSK